MKFGLACRAGRGVPALVIGVLIAFAVMGGAQAQAATVAGGPSLDMGSVTGYDDPVVQLTVRGIVNRAGDPSFAHSAVTTRAQMAVYLARVLQLPDSQHWYFTDVGAARWGHAEIGAVCDAGLMQGISPTLFSPDGPVSRQEAAAMVLVALRNFAPGQGTAAVENLTPYQVDGWLAGFKDSGLIDPRYRVAAATAYRLGLFDAPAEGWLLPKLGMTQYELVDMLERAFVEPLTQRVVFPTAVDAAGAVEAYPKLSKGSTGSLVMLLQQRLNVLHYPCGEPDGKYSNHTRDAVYAFQKYQRLKRTGYVDDAVWEALFAASAPVPVFQGSSGRRVEVDLTRQIMMLIEDNNVVMTVHVSTGKYGTPTGEWRTRTLSHGWRPTSLGPIYSPSYFMPRNAIHGYPSVPTYPASHGCVRTPIWIQDEIIDQLEMGELVHVFYNKATTAG